MKVVRFPKPDARDLNIVACTETALQRAMLKQTIDGNHTQLEDGTTIVWLDYELPVEFSNNPRKRCVDLIGRDNTGRYVLCELKFGYNDKDSPFDAEKEALVYLGEICFHWKEMDKNNIHRPYVYIKDLSNKYELPKFSWKEFVNSAPRIIIMADREYWKYWIDRAERQRNGTGKGKKDKKLISTKDPQVECFSIDISPDYFEKQLKETGEEKYTPKLSINKWEKVEL